MCELVHTSDILQAFSYAERFPSGLYGPVTIGRTLWPRRASESERRVARLNAVDLRWIIVFGTLACVALPSVTFAREHRSREVTREFQREHPCPSTGKTSRPCPSYRKDHIKPLARGGPDAVWNLQWQTFAAAKAKDRWELTGCGR